jgi:hypothetical protein
MASTAVAIVVAESVCDCELFPTLLMVDASCFARVSILPETEEI